MSFDPARFSGTVECGTAECAGRSDTTLISLAVRAGGDGSLTVALLAQERRTEILAIMGATAWPAFLAAVREAEQTVQALLVGGTADELDVMR